MSSPPKKLKKNAAAAAAAASSDIIEHGDANADDDMNEDPSTMYEDEEGAYRVGDIYIPPPIKPHCSNESKGSRLIITQITNNNFKSYAGEVALGPFCHRFHAIIGPNGSGKSNVIDSMLFVFGYRANKIRCKKLSVLIHNSKMFGNVDSCRVAVHFAQIVDKEDGTYEIVPGSEFIIAREAQRNNSSFYTIDNRRVHFKEVAKLLKQHNVDLDHNRFLILQGEVESIAMMKPKGQTDNECGHLEYLEDIIGTTRYKEPLQRIMARVDVLTEERTEKHNRCKMAEREINDLKQPMEEAVAYLKQENELTRTKNKQLQLYLFNTTKEHKKCTEECAEKTEKMKEHDEKLEAITKERHEKEEKIKEDIANYEKILKKKEEFEQMKKNAESKYEEIQSGMTETNKRRKQIANQLKKKEEELEELKRIPAKNEKEIAECETKINRLRKDKEESEAALQRNLLEYKTLVDPLTAEKAKHETDLSEVKMRNDSAKAELTLAESELKLVQQNETTEKRKYDLYAYSLEESKGTLIERKKTLDELEALVPAIKEEMVECDQSLKQYKEEEKEVRIEVNKLRAIIEEKTTTMQQTRHNNKLVDYLMRKKNSGQIPGILGRLGDLGGIDAKYDVAISTCCGRLDNIVVDNVSTAQACIDSLKRDNAGRATFIALDKVSHLANQMGPIATPENAPRLFDLIRVEDERLLPAFYFSLRDTLVATDLTQASRIAYGARRYRVVSLKGDVIEMVGTMSGGGRTQFRGKMGQTVKTKTSSLDTSMTGAADLEQMQVNAQALQEKINHLQQMQGDTEKRLVDLRKQLRAKEAELKKLRTDVTTFEQQIPALEEQLKRQEEIMNQTRSDPQKVAELESKIKTRQRTFEKCSAETKIITDKIDEIVKDIEAITADKITTIENSIKKSTQNIDKLTKNVLKLRVDIATSERNVKKSEENIATMKEEIETAKADLLKMADEREQAEKDGEEIEKRLKEIAKELVDTQSDSSGIKKEITALQKQESDLKLGRVEMKQEIDKIAKLIRELNAEIPHIMKKLEPLKLQNIPNEDPPDPLKTYSEDELKSYSMDDIQYKVSVLEENLKAKTPNLNVIDEYQKKMNVLVERIKVLEDITNKRNDMRKLFDDVKKRRYTEFMQGFNIITKKLKEMYQMITQGGNAELELVDSMDPFSEGIAFSVRPPRKSWKNISNLSGGEKTLSSLALVFALHYYKPSPLYFLDEIDAALDFKNVSIVANYIKDRTKNAQFIIISLRSNMFELADYLTGIYKVDDCTDSLTIENVAPNSIDSQPSQQTIFSSQATQPTQQPPPEPMSPPTDVSELILSPTSTASNATTNGIPPQTQPQAQEQPQPNESTQSIQSQPNANESTQSVRRQSNTNESMQSVQSTANANESNRRLSNANESIRRLSNANESNRRLSNANESNRRLSNANESNRRLSNANESMQSIQSQSIANESTRSTQRQSMVDESLQSIQSATDANESMQSIQSAANANESMQSIQSTSSIYHSVSTIEDIEPEN